MIGTEHIRNCKIFRDWCSMHPFHSQNGTAIQNWVSLLANRRVVITVTRALHIITCLAIMYYIIIIIVHCYWLNSNALPNTLPMADVQKKKKNANIRNTKGMKRTFYMPIKRMYTKAHNIHFMTTIVGNLL